MSYFHKIKDVDELRDEIMTETKNLLDTLNIPFSIHDVRAIITPNKSPMSEYPKHSCVAEIFSLLSESIKKTHWCKRLILFIPSLLFSFVIIAVFLMNLPFNCLSVFDDIFWGSNYRARLSYTRSCFVVLSSGIVVFKRELKLPFVCCNYLYETRKSETLYYTWANNLVLKSDTQPFPEKSSFIAFMIGTDIYVNKKETFLMLQQASEKCLRDNSV
eukprot:snap_masked-scaffold_11-processed-gene-10.49-mRNA-1 protein AED:1.00 eAED:1.00 QI:0/0/0/0/1/1/2/0/215